MNKYLIVNTASTSRAQFVRRALNTVQAVTNTYWYYDVEKIAFNEVLDNGKPGRRLERKVVEPLIRREQGCHTAADMDIIREHVVAEWPELNIEE